MKYALGWVMLMLLTAMLAGCSAPEAAGVGDSMPTGAPAMNADGADEDLMVEIFAMNVGKADAILVTVGERCYLVDTGTKDSYDTMKAHLDRLGVDHLNGVILTHTDKDHGGGMEKLSESEISVDAWYASSLYYEKKTEKHQAVKAARERNTEVIWLNAGDVLDLGDGCCFEVLSPQILDTEDENNNSMVLRLVTPEGNALLAGDMEKEAEAILLASGADLSAAYLKVGHHGRDDATSAAFAASVAPQIAVISTDSVEQPDSPAPVVLAALEAAGATVYVTQDYEAGVRVALRNGQAVFVGQ